MAEFNSTAKVFGSEDSGMKDCTLCRDLWNQRVAAEIIHKQTGLPVCVDCLLTKWWLMQEIDKKQGLIKLFHFQHHCETCIATSSGHPRVLWRFCLECCQHVCADSHPCQAKKLVIPNFKYRLMNLGWSSLVIN